MDCFQKKKEFHTSPAVIQLCVSVYNNLLNALIQQASTAHCVPTGKTLMAVSSGAGTTALGTYYGELWLFIYVCLILRYIRSF